MQVFSHWWKDFCYTDVTGHEVNTIVRFYFEPNGLAMCHSSHFRRNRTETIIALMKAGF